MNLDSKRRDILNGPGAHKYVFLSFCFTVLTYFLFAYAELFPFMENMISHPDDQDNNGMNIIYPVLLYIWTNLIFTFALIKYRKLKVSRGRNFLYVTSVLFTHILVHMEYILLNFNTHIVGLAIPACFLGYLVYKQTEFESELEPETIRLLNKISQDEDNEEKDI